MRRLLPLLLLMPACTTPEPEPGPEPMGLEFALGTESALAGETVSWTAALHFSDGSVRPVAVDVQSSLQPNLHPSWTSAGGGTLVPEVAGQHLVSATMVWDGASYFAGDWVRVDPAAAASVDLALSGIQASAGDALTFTVAAVDAFGNSIDRSKITVAASSTDVVVAEPRFASTVPGVHTLVASVDGVVDEEQFRVVAGAPDYIDLTLSTVDLEVYETAIATAIVRDAFGNALDARAELSVEGAVEPAIAGPNLTFLGEGWYTVFANYEDLEASVGPFLIDSTGPMLTIVEPERGDWEVNTSALMMGTAVDSWSAIGLLTVNGMEVPVNGDGSFTHTLDYDFGLNVVHTSASDTDGNSATDTRSVLDGSFYPGATVLGDGIIGRVNEDGFEVLESLGEGLINDTDLTALVPNPVVSTSSESCIDLIFTTLCVTWYSLDLYIWDPSIGSTDLEIDPTSGGYLDTSFVVYNPSLDWEADGTVLGISLGADGSIYADSITARMELYPSVSGGELQLGVGAVDVTSSNFTFDWDSWIYDVMSFFGLDLSSLIQGYMEDALESAITDEVPSAVADALGGLELATSFDVQGTEIVLAAEPFSATVDDYGMSLGLGTEVYPTTWVHDEVGLGSLYGAYTAPTYASSSPGFQVSLGEDFLNQALYAFWGAGVLDQALDTGGLDLGAFGSILGFSDLRIATKALLPPVVVPGTGSAMLDLQMGDLELSLYDGETVEENLRLRVYVTLFAGLDLDVVNGNLSPTIGDPVVYFDVTLPEANTVASKDTEDLLQALVPLLLPALTGAISEIPIPEIAGFSITIDALRLDGPENGFVTVDADIGL